MFGKLFNPKKDGVAQGARGVSPDQSVPQDPNQQYNNQDAQANTPQGSNQPQQNNQQPPPPDSAQQPPPQPGAGPQQNQAPVSAGNPPPGQAGQAPPEGHPGAGLPKGQTNPALGNSSAKVDTSALSHLDPRASLVLTHAQEESRRIHQQSIEPEQLLFGLLYDQQISKLLGELAVDVGRLSKEIQAKERVGTYKGQPVLSNVSQQVFDQAYRDAKMRGSTFISPEDILVVLFGPNYSTAQTLQTLGLKKEVVVDKLSKSTTGGYGRKSTLEKYAIDLTAEAREGKLDPVAGREKEIDRILHILLRRTKNNPIIIGETGVGKTAIVEGLAQKIVANAVPKDILNKRVFQLDVASLVAGASHRGEFEERIKGVITEVLGSNGNIILFIDEIHSLMGAGESEGMNAANIVKPYLARGQLQIIGATTTTEYRKHFEKDKAFERRFQPVTAEEPSDENAFEMMKVLRSKYEKFHRVKIPDDALKESIKLAKKYIGERFLPDKSIDLLDEGCAEVKLQVDTGKRGDSDVKKADIEKVVSAWTGIPITKLTEDESEKLLKLEERIHQRLIDQQEAVVAVSEAVRRGRIGLASGQRPTASFVFLGPTGVGKTELAKTLAELLFGRDDAMARLDMSEFMEKHEVAKLIGAPPGYVGYEEGGVLTEAVRKKPYSIVLFDEIEKAHPDVFNILLQLLEDGRLTDNKGNVISFKNTIVICTSNIGSAIIQQFLSKQDKAVKMTSEQLNKQFSELQKIVKDELIKFLRPELLNRFDEVVIFKPLRPEHMAGIVRLGIAKTAGLLKEQGFHLQITEKAIAKLAKDGYDPVYGARPLRRLIQTAIENPIALAIISKKFVPGDTIVIDYNENINAFMFNKGGQTGDIAQLTDSEFKLILQKIAKPEDITTDFDKEIFSKLHEKVVAASAGTNPASTGVDNVSTDAKPENIEPKPANTDVAPASTEADKATTEAATASTETNPASTEATPASTDADKANKEAATTSTGANPVYAAILAVNASTPDTEISDIRQKLKDAKEKGDELAKEILDVAAGIAQQLKAVEREKKILLSIVNPETVTSVAARDKFKELHDKVVVESQNNNALATAILQLKPDSPQSAIEKIMEDLNKGKDTENELATDILALMNSEISKESEVALEANPTTKFKKFMKQLGNPLYLAEPENKKKFSDLYDKLSEAGKQNHPLAEQILNITDITSDDDIEQLESQLEQAKDQGDPLAAEILATIQDAIKQNEIMKIKAPLLLIANPITAQTADEKEMYTNIHTKVDEASQKGNKLATSVLNLTDAVTSEEISELSEQLSLAKTQNDEIAIIILNAIDNVTNGTTAQLQTQTQNTAQPTNQQQSQAPSGNGQNPPDGQPGQSAGEAGQPVNPQSNPADPSQNFPFGQGQQNPPTGEVGQPPPQGNYSPVQNTVPPPANGVPPYQPPMNNSNAPYQNPNGSNGTVNYGGGGTAMQPDGKVH